MRAAQLGTPDREITRLPIVKRNLLRMRLMAHPVFFPNQRQQPGNHDRHKEQHADHRQRKADIIGKPNAIVAVEEKPGRQREPSDKDDGGSINPRVKLIEYRPVVGNKFPAHENRLPDLIGIGAGFIPAIMDTSVLDGVIQVDPAAAKEMARRAAREEGMLVGISSGATLAAIAQKLPELGDGARVIGFNYDTGERYLSVPEFLPEQP